MTYTVIIKVQASLDTRNDTFIKYHNVSDLVKLTTYLDIKFPSWCWFNVFDSKTKNQIGSFTKNNKPQRPKINY